MIGAASGVVITASPSSMIPGEPITITIDGLSNSSAFSLIIEATLQVTPGQDYLFETTDFGMPISLTNGQISATTTGTKKATYSARKGTTEVSVTKAADADGVFSFSQAQSVPAGTYDFFRLQGTPLPATSTVVSTIQIIGEKTGPDSSRMSFAVNGIDNGRVQVVVYVDGNQVLYQTVTIGSGSSQSRQQPPCRQPPLLLTMEGSHRQPQPLHQQVCISQKHFFQPIEVSRLWLMV